MSDDAPKTERFCPLCETVMTDDVCPRDQVPTVRADFGRVVPDLLGRVVGGGRYRIERLLGEGASGRVYAATQLSVGREVALKLLHPRHVEDRRQVRRFYREARAATRLTSMHVVHVYDFGVDDDTQAPFLVMELLRGRTLRALLDADGPLPPRRAAELVAQVARALIDAARAGIVHRDLKPSNILLLETGDGSEVVKVTDFGIAKELTETETETLTAVGAAIGTPAYMAPEQINSGTVDARTDLYALGCVLYELLSGGRPFPTRVRAELMVDHLLTPPPELGDELPSGEPLPAALRALLMRLLEKRPEDRPRDARAVLDALDAVISDTATAPARDLTPARPATPPPEMAGRALIVPPPLTPATADDDDHAAPRTRLRRASERVRSWTSRLLSRPSAEEKLLKKAQTKRRRWQRHLRAYLTVNVGLFAINVLTAIIEGFYEPWSLLTAASWGMGLGFHGLSYREWREEHADAVARAAAATGQPNPDEPAPLPERLPAPDAVADDPIWTPLLARCRRAVTRAEEALARSDAEPSAIETSTRALRDGLADVERLAAGARRIRAVLSDVSPGPAENQARIDALAAQSHATSDPRLQRVYQANHALLVARQRRLQQLDDEMTRARVRAQGFALAAENVRLDIARLGAPRTSELSGGLKALLSELDAEVEVMREVEDELRAL